MDPVPDPLLLRKSGNAGDRTRDLCICSQKLRTLDHRGGPCGCITINKQLCYTKVYIFTNSGNVTQGDGKSKCKDHYETAHEGPEGDQRYRSTLSLTSALDVGGWSMPRPGRFTPGKDPVPILQEAGWPQGRSGRVRKISPPPGFDPRTVQPEASRYTD